MLTDREIEDILRKRVLDKIPFSFNNRYDRNWVETVTVEMLIDHATNDLAFKINMQLPGIREDGWIFRPLTWWDGFKSAYFPQWLLRRFPAKEERLHVQSIYHLYPQNQFGRGVIVGRGR